MYLIGKEYLNLKDLFIDCISIYFGVKKKYIVLNNYI